MIRLKYAEVDYTPSGAVTRFHDGTSYGASPHPWDHHYHVIAHRCGYGDDLMGYTREHEACHSILCEFLFDRPSDVLWGLAHRQEVPASEAAFEEIASQALQRFIRAGERPIVGGVDWDRLRHHALSVLDFQHELEAA